MLHSLQSTHEFMAFSCTFAEHVGLEANLKSSIDAFVHGGPRHFCKKGRYPSVDKVMPWYKDSHLIYLRYINYIHLV